VKYLESQDVVVDPIKHDCRKDPCAGCGIAYFEIAAEKEQMHLYPNRFGDPICICSTCRSNILAKEKEHFSERFLKSLWGTLWKEHSTLNRTFTGPECHNSKRELLLDVQELARQLFEDG